MAFTPLDTFTTIVATNTLNLGTLDALAIQAPSSRMFVSSFSLPHLGAQRVVDPLPVAAVTPHSKVMVHTFPFWVLSGQHSPLDASYHYVEDGVDHHSHVQTARASTRLWWWNQFSDNIPLTVGKIGRIQLVVHNPRVPDRFYRHLTLLRQPLRKRSIIETINDQLKNISQIEHSRHRSFDNFIVNLLSGLIAYCHQPKKPSLNLDQALFNTLVIPN